MGMTTMSCSQAKREGGERHGQCELKDSERRRKNLQIPKEGHWKAPELAWDLGVRAIAVKSEHSGWPFERQVGNATRLGKNKFEHQKSTMGPQSQPWECLQSPRHSHATLFDFKFFSPVLSPSWHSSIVTPSLTSNVSQRGFFRSRPCMGSLGM